MNKEKLLEVIKKLKSDKRKFVQSIDLICNLKGVDLKKENITFSIVLPHKIKNKKICFFSEKPLQEEIFDKIILKERFSEYDKKKAKKLAKEFDFFVAQATLMPSVASIFGKALGSAGKMPSPAIGSIVTKTDTTFLKNIIERLNKTIKIKLKDLSVKLSVGKQNMKDEEIIENILTAAEDIIKALPKGKENVKKFLIKTTMGKPIELKLDDLVK